ncbi:hypothetical protein IAG41_04500 [Sphingomonas sp. JC676]|uniref:hypothetical protein n=1 Tax=Sphingomonas sp. JC676 TaxID=2768065 RepID=UPI001657CD22|nr:hypothetical protein [Sphingomonas sp. JC676]MBC9031644.1 hypothetical protein [Sphingomonas sp. JC676]
MTIRMIAAFALLILACFASPVEAQHFRIKIGSASSSAPAAMTLVAGNDWTGVADSGNSGGPLTESATQIGSFPQKAIARFAEPEKMWIDSTDHTIGLGAYLDTGIAYVDFTLEGNTVRVTAPTYNARLDMWLYNVRLRAPPGKSGEAILYARVVPNSGYERLVKLPVTLDTNGLNAPQYLYVSPSGSNTAPANNPCTNPTQRCQTLTYAFSKVVSPTARYVIKMAAGTYNEDNTSSAFTNSGRMTLVEPDDGLTPDQVVISRSDRRIFLGTWTMRIANARFRNLTIDQSKIQAITGGDANNHPYGGNYVFDHVRFIDSNGLDGRVIDGYSAGYWSANGPDGLNQQFFIANVVPFNQFNVIESTGDGPHFTGANLYRNSSYTNSADGLTFTASPPNVFGLTFDQTVTEFHSAKAYEGIVRVAENADVPGGQAVVWDGVSRTTIYLAPYAAPDTITMASGSLSALFSAAPRLVNGQRFTFTDGCAVGETYTVKHTNLFNQYALPGTTAPGSLPITMATPASCNISGAHYKIWPQLATGTVQPNHSMRVLTGALAGGGTDCDSGQCAYPINSGGTVGISAADVLASRITVLGDLRALVPGDKLFPYLTFHADAFQQLGIESLTSQNENVFVYKYKAVGLTFQPMFNQTNNLPRPHAGTITTSDVNYTVSVPDLATVTAYINGTRMNVTDITGTIAIGQLVNYSGAPASLTVSDGSYAKFNGQISGTTLTVNSVTPGTALAIGQLVNYPGAPAELHITAGSGTTWTLDQDAGTVSAQEMFSNNWTLSQNLGTVTSRTMHTLIMPKIRAKDMIQLAASPLWYRRVATADCATFGVCTGTLTEAFDSNVASATYFAPGALKDVAIINAIIANTSNLAFYSQFQGGAINFNVVNSTILAGDPATGTSSGGKFVFRTGNGTGFGLDGFYVRDSIIQGNSYDGMPVTNASPWSAGTFPQQGFGRNGNGANDNNHWIRTTDPGFNGGTNASTGIVSGLTFANGYWAPTWSGRTIATARWPVDINNHVRATGDRVGAVAKAP